METEQRKEEEKRIKTRCLSGNFHTHTVFCDGRNTAQEMAEQALAIGFKQLGFSGHMDPDITMDLAAYDAEIRRLQEVYRGRLDILRGVELDTLFVPRSAEEARLLGEMEYLIGSTHFIESPSGGPPGTVDDTLERLAGFCREEYGGDWYRLAKAYYETEAQVYEKMLQVFSRNDQPEPLSR
ncbi:MAG: PHP domain-containing protein, partial [Eubacteriales bacterium]|nr:PHP domain-containing protein [Eubacteriales bacterium]